MRKKLTFIELPFVIAVIAILAGFPFPVLHKARKKANAMARTGPTKQPGMFPADPERTTTAWETIVPVPFADAALCLQAAGRHPGRLTGLVSKENRPPATGIRMRNWRKSSLMLFGFLVRSAGGWSSGAGRKELSRGSRSAGRTQVCRKEEGGISCPGESGAGRLCSIWRFRGCLVPEVEA